MVVAADRPEAVEARDAHARRRVGVGRAAGRGVADREPERAGDGRRVLDQPRAARRASPSATSAPSARSRPSTSGTTVASAIRRTSASAASSSARATPRTSTSSEQRSATTLGRVPPPMTPTLTVTPGQRPLSACRSRDDPGRLEDRAAALLGLDAGVGRAAVDGRSAGRGCPCATRRCRRSRGRTRGRGRRRRRGAISRMCGVEVGEPISSSGLATNTSRSNGQPAELAEERLERVQPREQARLHVGDARAAGDAVGDRERPLGRGPGIEHGVHVPDEQDARRRRRGPSKVADDRVPEPPGRVGPDARRVAPRRGQEVAGPAPDLVDARRRVAAAVDVDEALEVAQVARQVGLDRRAERLELGRRRGRRSGRPWRGV